MKFVVSLIAVLGTAEALKLGEGETSNGNILETNGINNDFSLVAEDDDQVEGCFLMWLAKFGKEALTEEELEEMKANWAKNNRKIRDANRQANESAEANPVMHNHNVNSAMSDE